VSVYDSQLGTADTIGFANDVICCDRDQARLNDPVGALMRLPGAASEPTPPMPPTDTLLLLLPPPLPVLPPLVLRSVVPLREPARLEGFEVGLSIQSNTSLCELAAMPTSSTRCPAPPFLRP